MKQSRCERCIYRSAPGMPYRCNYAAITGHTRKAVPPGRCRKFREGERIDPDKREPRSTPDKKREACAPEQKARNGMPRRQQRTPGPKPKYDWEEARRLYGQGANDGQIGRALGCRPQLVCAWRRRWGLPANSMVGSHGTRTDCKKEADS